MIRINEEFLKRAIEYAGCLFIGHATDYTDSPEDEDARDGKTDEELAREAILRDTDDLGPWSFWDMAVRAYYDACVEMSAQKEVDVADKHKGCSSCQGTGWVNGEPGNSCDIPSARISDTERPPVRSEDEP